MRAVVLVRRRLRLAEQRARHGHAGADGLQLVVLVADEVALGDAQLYLRRRVLSKLSLALRVFLAYFGGTQGVLAQQVGLRLVMPSSTLAVLGPTVAHQSSTALCGCVPFGPPSDDEAQLADWLITSPSHSYHLM